MISTRTKIASLINILIFVLSVVLFLTFSFVLSKQKSTYREQELVRAERFANQQHVSSIMSVLDDTKNERESLNTRILKEEQVIELLALVETIGKEQGVVLTTDSLNVEPVDDTFENLEISVKVQGSYEAVMRTLKILEHIPYQVNVGGVQITHANDKNWNGFFTIEITKFKKI